MPLCGRASCVCFQEGRFSQIDILRGDIIRLVICKNDTQRLKFWGAGDRDRTGKTTHHYLNNGAFCT